MIILINLDLTYKGIYNNHIYKGIYDTYIKVYMIHM